MLILKRYTYFFRFFILFIFRFLFCLFSFVSVCCCLCCCLYTHSDAFDDLHISLFNPRIYCTDMSIYPDLTLAVAFSCESEILTQVLCV